MGNGEEGDDQMKATKSASRELSNKKATTKKKKKSVQDSSWGTEAALCCIGLQQVRALPPVSANVDGSAQCRPGRLRMPDRCSDNDSKSKSI